MQVATGHYINIYNYYNDIYVVLNEPNDPPTIEQVEQTKKIIQDGINNNEIIGSFCKQSLSDKINEVFPYGADVIFNN